MSYYLSDRIRDGEEKSEKLRDELSILFEANNRSTKAGWPNCYFLSSADAGGPRHNLAHTLAHASPVPCVKLTPDVCVLCILKLPNGDFELNWHNYGSCPFNERNQIKDREEGGNNK